MAWPKEYGGQARSYIDQALFKEEMAYHRAPGIDFPGVGMCGPTILTFGNEEQKKQHLPPIARGEILWCQGFSEPEAGSDLAGVKTTAVLKGDHFVVNGQKGRLDVPAGPHGSAGAQAQGHQLPFAGHENSRRRTQTLAEYRRRSCFQ